MSDSPNDKKEDSVDINFDSISEINLKNVSFYSVNDQTTNDGKFPLVTIEITKSKSEKKIDLESVRMLPYYIEKVSQNIKFIDQIISRHNSVTISKSNSKEKYLTNNTSASNCNDQQSNNVLNIQNIVRKSVEGVNEIFNKRLNGNSLNTSSNSINGSNKENNTNSTGNIKEGNINSKENNCKENNYKENNYKENNYKEGYAIQNTNLVPKNFAVIEEKDEDLFSRNSNMFNEPVKKREMKNLNKASFIGVTKKITVNNLAINDTRSSNNMNPHNNQTTTFQKVNSNLVNSNNNINNLSSHRMRNIKNIGLSGKTSFNTITNTHNVPSNISSNLKKSNNYLANTNSTLSDRTDQGTNKKNKISTTTTSANPTTTTININKQSSINSNLNMNKKKKNSATTNSNFINNFTQEGPNNNNNNSHKKTYSVSYTTDPNLLTTTKSKRKFTMPIPTLSERITKKEKTLINKKSTENLSTINSFKNNNIRKTSSVSENRKCNCNCHFSRDTLTGAQILNKRISQLDNNAKNNFNVNLINKLNDLNETNLKSFVQLFYIYNEIGDINNSNENKPVASPNHTIVNINTKENQNDLLRLLKNFIESNEDEGEVNFKNLSSYSHREKDSSFVIMNLDQRKSELSILLDYNKIEKVALIQRRWREVRIRRILYPLMTLDTTYNKFDNFSFFNCNKYEILKLGKLHLYTSLLKYSDKFKQVLSLINQAGIIWQELTKNQNIFSPTENLIKDIVVLSDNLSNNQITMSGFHSAMSKIISHDIKINTNLKDEFIKKNNKDTKTNNIFENREEANKITRKASHGSELRKYSTNK